MCAAVCICRMIFLAGASNNHNDSFPFVLSFSSFCALHHFRRARSALSCYLPLFVRFPMPSFLWALPILSALGGIGWRGSVLLWGAVGRGGGRVGGGGGGGGSSHPLPSFPLRREILARGGSLLVSLLPQRCAWCWWGWPLASAGPHIPVCPGGRCMLLGGMLALAGVALVDHARSAHRQSKGSGLGLVPLCTRPRSWGEGGIRGLHPPL